MTELKELFGSVYQHFGFSGSSEGKVSACNAGELGSIPGSGRSPGEGNANILKMHMHFDPTTILPDIKI